MNEVEEVEEVDCPCVHTEWRSSGLSSPAPERSSARSRLIKSRNPR